MKLTELLLASDDRWVREEAATRIEELQRALRFYADPKTWAETIKGLRDETTPHAFTDRGCIARAVLNSSPSPVGERKIHPLALEGNKSGAFDMNAGDRVVYEIDGRHGRADEFIHDGDAFVTFDDGNYETVKWNHLHKEPPDPVGERKAALFETALQLIALCSNVEVIHDIVKKCFDDVNSRTLKPTTERKS